MRRFILRILRFGLLPGQVKNCMIDRFSFPAGKKRLLLAEKRLQSMDPSDSVLQTALLNTVSMAQSESFVPHGRPKNLLRNCGDVEATF